MLTDEDDRITPVEPHSPIEQLYVDMAEVKLLVSRQTEILVKMNDRALEAYQEVPKLRAEIRALHLWHAWFPTAVVVAALLVRMLFLR
jgi:hypothetical protein